jgi:hypothetical protein
MLELYLFIVESYCANISSWLSPHRAETYRRIEFVPRPRRLCRSPILDPLLLCSGLLAPARLLLSGRFADGGRGWFSRRERDTTIYPRCGILLLCVTSFAKNWGYGAAPVADVSVVRGERMLQRRVCRHDGRKFGEDRSRLSWIGNRWGGMEGCDSSEVEASFCQDCRSRIGPQRRVEPLFPCISQTTWCEESPSLLILCLSQDDEDVGIRPSEARPRTGPSYASNEPVHVPRSRGSRLRQTSS